MAEYTIPIPEKSQKAFWSNKGKSPQNAGLIFDRFMPDWADKADTLKEEGLKSTLEAAKRADSDLLKEWNARWQRLVDSAEAKYFELKTDWRLIAGFGRKGSLEAGFTFHRYGFPYLPGSSLKGLARAYGLLEIAFGLEESKLKIIRDKVAENNHKKAEDIGLLSALDTTLSRDAEETFKTEFETCQPSTDIKEMAEAFRCIFGTTERAGKAIFFDAIPSAVPKLELDIMNPHYPDYYRDMGSKNPTEYPTNWQNPNPVKFLTVASGTVFRFAIGWRSSPNDNEKSETKWNGWFKGEQIKQQADPNAPRLIKLARRWLQGGLLELGAGGKTSAGYGYFVE